MRVLVVTNLTPDARVPARGSFVRDQLRALREAGVEVELFWFPVGKRHYGPATMRVRRLLRRERFDLVHAHYGLAGWCAALAGARPLVVTFHGTDVGTRPRDACPGASRAASISSPAPPRRCSHPSRGAPVCPRPRAGPRSCPAGPTWSAFGRCPGGRHVAGSDSTRGAATCSSLPRPDGPRRATTARGSSRGSPARSCWKAATSPPS